MKRSRALCLVKFIIYNVTYAGNLKVWIPLNWPNFSQSERCNMVYPWRHINLALIPITSKTARFGPDQIVKKINQKLMFFTSIWPILGST